MKAAAVAAEARTHVAVNFMVTVVVVGFGNCRPAAVEAAAGRRVKHTVKKIPPILWTSTSMKIESRVH